ncbi:alpha-ketoglutarate-dependent 2,4-dichlorophenoxyacetate dioxygenase [Enhydrobacter aerosaccus]|uniref:Alpha-ketoglutarate-dependent 2,4-dichlorophenoxyacetate dioxygenase n=1 Tax=Enhydrobacter aerosaccus TaxID=225324 RepID=A0A1T4RN95_9HYPH|nr:TauD/TfdA family dioxygenase [Enhydrobacter aerosaccus]SKA17218.1 alpha-ketoglutarate-dependent 2,4-dichlorophenoxyacetate dioxygenase [Enhydrobacter aerosaccus]
MELIPLGPGFGVEVRGVGILDVATDAEAYKAVRAAFEDHSLLVFRDQPVADDVQVAFSRAFGPLELTKVSSLGQNTFYSRLTNTMNGKVVPPDHRQVLVAKANALWHTDSSFKKTPALASVLTARVLPGEGGETEYTSTRLAWERLPTDLQERLTDAVATHSYANSRDQIHPDLATEMERRALPPVRWRLNWRNPVNGRRALYVASHAYAIDGMEERAARQLLAELLGEATRSDYVYSHKWRQGDVVMWDNRAMLHRGRPWNYADERTMVRTTISATDADGLNEVRPTAVH